MSYSTFQWIETNVLLEKFADWQLYSYFFRMPWLSFAGHLKPSPNFVFFFCSSHIALQILTSFFSSESLAILIAFSPVPLPRCYRGYKEQWANQSDDSRTKNRVLLSIKGREL